MSAAHVLGLALLVISGVAIMAVVCMLSWIAWRARGKPAPGDDGWLDLDDRDCR